MIKGVTSFEGFLAWQKLHRKYNSKTMARAIRLMTDVTGPKQVKEIREVEAAITAWETRVRKLESEFGESLTSTMKIAIVTEMTPTSIQDYVYTNVDGQTEYPAVVARISTWAENKAARRSSRITTTSPTGVSRRTGSRCSRTTSRRTSRRRRPATLSGGGSARLRCLLVR